MEMPTSIGHLTKLTNLNVDRNRLFELPTEVGNLVCLNVLSLRDNKLHFLPNELGDCSELHVLDVSGNRYNHFLGGNWFFSDGRSLSFVLVDSSTDCSTYPFL